MMEAITAKDLIEILKQYGEETKVYIDLLGKRTPYTGLIHETIEDELILYVQS